MWRLSKMAVLGLFWRGASGEPKEIRLSEGTDIEGKGKPASSGKGGVKNRNEPKELVLSREPDPLAPGPLGNDLLLPLRGHCFHFNDSKPEYTYTFCPFHNISQLSIKNKKNRFVLGVWGRWHENRLAQVYDDGDQCGNESRRVTVDTMCGGSDFDIGKLLEPSPCNYTMTFVVPIPCDLMPEGNPTITESHSDTKAEIGRFFSRVDRRRQKAEKDGVAGEIDNLVAWSWPWSSERLSNKQLIAEVSDLKNQLDDCRAA
mmetsp:Transcript_55625/g.111546  ORF Transcript_55625/g.111546 Transcript_55625/m.111546 type:complete len:259 (-) Transcript_55625:330-1106(-)